MKLHGYKKVVAAMLLAAVVALMASAVPASARPLHATSTQYGFLTQPNSSALDNGSRSQSIVVLSSGTGFVEYGFQSSPFIWAFGCSISSCTKNYNAMNGPGFLTGVYCRDKTGTSQWSCQYP